MFCSISTDVCVKEGWCFAFPDPLWKNVLCVFSYIPTPIRKTTIIH